ncbi:hypothetical protein B5S33_g3981 [[Candida] boidinii]|nr:hypothetical protein B5S33_g3981 [[Candida] boidinii]
MSQSPLFKDRYKVLTKEFHDKLTDTTSTITCTILQFDDKLIISLSTDGITDITYSLELSKIQERSLILYDDDGEEYFNPSKIVPNVIIGDVSNLKDQVMASHIGFLLNKFVQKNVILNTSGKFWFYKGKKMNDESISNDHEKLQFILGLIESCYRLK